jgi:hypothetical protein
VTEAPTSTADLGWSPTVAGVVLAAGDPKGERIELHFFRRQTLRAAYNELASVNPAVAGAFPGAFVLERSTPDGKPGELYAAITKALWADAPKQNVWLKGKPRPKSAHALLTIDADAEDDTESHWTLEVPKP